MLHPFVAQISIILIKVVCLLVAIAYYTIAERKIMAAIQRRRGPNVVGFWGLLQPLADGLKLIAKEMITPSHANSKVFIVAPIAILTLGLLTWSIVPFCCLDYSENALSQEPTKAFFLETLEKNNDTGALKETPWWRKKSLMGIAVIVGVLLIAVPAVIASPTAGAASVVAFVGAQPVMIIGTIIAGCSSAPVITAVSIAGGVGAGFIANMCHVPQSTTTVESEAIDALTEAVKKFKEEHPGEGAESDLGAIETMLSERFIANKKITNAAAQDALDSPMSPNELNELKAMFDTVEMEKIMVKTKKMSEHTQQVAEATNIEDVHNANVEPILISSVDQMFILEKNFLLEDTTKRSIKKIWNLDVEDDDLLAQAIARVKENTPELIDWEELLQSIGGGAVNRLNLNDYTLSFRIINELAYVTATPQVNAEMDIINQANADIGLIIDQDYLQVLLRLDIVKDEDLYAWKPTQLIGHLLMPTSESSSKIADNVLSGMIGMGDIREVVNVELNNLRKRLGLEYDPDGLNTEVLSLGALTRASRRLVQQQEENNYNFLTELDNIANVSYGLLFILALSSLTVYGLIIAGWSSNSKYAFLGALRSAAQMISYEVAISLVILPIILMAGALNLARIAFSQIITTWFFLPLSPISIIFFISMIAETNRTPFDLPEAEAELVAGYNVEYSSIIFAMFFLAEYSNMILMSLLKIILFFGGWDTKIITEKVPATGVPIKGLVFCFLFVLIRATFPRYRYDQLMDIGWKIFLPLSTGFLVYAVGLVVAFLIVPISKEIKAIIYTGQFL